MSKCHNNHDNSQQGLNLFILCMLLISPATCYGEDSFFGYATATTDYRAYGISLTQNDPAIQILAGYDMGNGLYAGTFLSTFNLIDDSSPFDAGEKLETDLYIGYRHHFNDDIYLSTTVYQYIFQGTHSGISFDFTELMLDLNTQYGKFSFGQTLNNILGDLSVDKAYRLEYSLSKALFESGVSLDLQLGRWDTQSALGDDYIYYNLGLSMPLGPVTACLAYNGSDDSGEGLFGKIAKPTLYGKVTWAF